MGFTNAILRGLFATAALLTAACGTPPQISVIGVDVVEKGATTSELAVRLEIQNLTGEPIRLDTWEYNLRMQGQGVYSGQWVAAITIPAESRVLTAIPAVVNNGDLPTTDASWNVDGWIRYLEPTRFSQLLYDLGLNRPSTNFSGRGDKIGSGGSVPSAG
ncbi:MAG: hypothetical protein RLZZ288_99 [Planctomycetota bacterium]